MIISPVSSTIINDKPYGTGFIHRFVRQSINKSQISPTTALIEGVCHTFFGIFYGQSMRMCFQCPLHRSLRVIQNNTKGICRYFFKLSIFTLFFTPLLTVLYTRILFESMRSLFLLLFVWSVVEACPLFFIE